MKNPFSKLSQRSIRAIYTLITLIVLSLCLLNFSIQMFERVTGNDQCRWVDKDSSKNFFDITKKFFHMSESFFQVRGNVIDLGKSLATRAGHSAADRFSFRLSRSFFSTITYRSGSYSYPFTMSSVDTGLPHFLQTF